MDILQLESTAKYPQHPHTLNRELMASITNPQHPHTLNHEFTASITNPQHPHTLNHESIASIMKPQHPHARSLSLHHQVRCRHAVGRLTIYAAQHPCVYTATCALHPWLAQASSRCKCYKVLDTACTKTRQVSTGDIPISRI